MVDPALGVDATVVSTVEVGFNPSYIDEEISCDKGHTQPQRDGCKRDARREASGQHGQMEHRHF